nr:DUF3226 domain-containing protein [[Phormidium] sp. ETS-05]
MPKKSDHHQLLVEGKNDQHVIWGLCQQYQLPELFDVVASAKSTEGIDALLSGLPARINTRNLNTLGIVVDADDDLVARWQSLTNKLRESGYHDIPSLPRLGLPANRPIFAQSGSLDNAEQSITGNAGGFCCCSYPG